MVLDGVRWRRIEGVEPEESGFPLQRISSAVGGPIKGGEVMEDTEVSKSLARGMD
jgi:hypothetical protein